MTFRLRVTIVAGCLVAALLAYCLARPEAPAPTLLVRDRHGRFLAEIGAGPDGGAGYWPVKELPERVVAATLAIEDRRFWVHPGVDPIAIVRAAVGNLRSGKRVSGASTIAMQVARMQRPGARTHLRKIREMVFALALTARYGREAVLRHYLRIVPYGNRIHGIGFAARRYLNKPVEDLSWAEIAFLAAIPQAPSRMNPYDPVGHARAVARGKRILAALRDRGVMDQSEHELALRQIERIRMPFLERRPRAAMHAVLRLEELLGSPNVRQAFAERPLVTTYLDLDVQEQIGQWAADWIDALQPKGAGNAAAVVLERPGSRVVAWLGSTDYFEARQAGAIDYARVARLAGSTVKPFLYARALDRGVITPTMVIDDLPRGRRSVANADRLFLGPMLPRFALANSRNVPAVEVLQRLGNEDAYEFLRDLGLHDGYWPARRFGVGLAVGGLPTTLERLVSAYAMLAEEGMFQPPRWYEGQELVLPRRLVSETTARRITRYLSDPMARLPSFARMGALEYPFAVAVKTGTSSEARDAWAVAYSSRYVAGVWIGHPNARPMHDVTASSSAAVLVKQILRHLHRNERRGLRNIDFPPPAGSQPVRLCALTGKLATPACDRVVTEWLAVHEKPAEACDAHIHVAVDVRTGLAADAWTPRATVQVRTALLLEPRYARWAVSSDLSTVRFADFDSKATPRIRIVAPADGLRVLRDPESPNSAGTLALEAVVDPPVEQIVWYVNGEPYRVADFPYAARWPVKPGKHRIEVRLPYRSVASEPVFIVAE